MGYVSAAEDHLMAFLVLATNDKMNVSMLGVFMNRSNPRQRVARVPFHSLNELLGQDLQGKVLRSFRRYYKAVMTKIACLRGDELRFL
jgi:hypothetical protein